MAIELVGRKAVGLAGSTSYQTVSLTDLTGGLASQPSEDDYIIVGSTFPNSDQTIDIVDAGDVAYPTTICDLFRSDGASCNLHVAAKFAGSTPDTSVKVQGSGSTSSGQAIGVEVYRGVNTTTQMDVTATTATGANTGRPNPPSITPSTSGAKILTVGGGTAYFSAGSDFTSSDFDNFLSDTGSDTGSGTIGLGEKSWTSGAFDPAQFGGGNTSLNSSWAAVCIALRPEPAAYSLTASAASFILTGAAASLLIGRKIAAASGAFVVTGASAGLYAARKIGATAGSFALAGTTAGLLRGLRFIVDAGSFTLTGASAAFVYGRRIVAEAASFVLTGSSASLLAARKIAADAGVFALTGAATGLSVARKIIAGSGAFVVSSVAAFFRLPPPAWRTSASVAQDRTSRSEVQYRTSASAAIAGSKSEPQDRSSASTPQDRSSR